MKDAYAVIGWDYHFRVEDGDTWDREAMKYRARLCDLRVHIAEDGFYVDVNLKRGPNEPDRIVRLTARDLVTLSREVEQERKEGLDGRRN